MRVVTKTIRYGALSCLVLILVPVRRGARMLHSCGTLKVPDWLWAYSDTFARITGLCGPILLVRRSSPC